MTDRIPVAPNGVVRFNVCEGNSATPRREHARHEDAKEKNDELPEEKNNQTSSTNAD
jgi:hypothetical protein